jgi:MFS family permease
MMQQLTGINAFVSQMGYVVTAYNVGFGQFVPVIMGIVQFIAAIYSMSCLQKTRRRVMILFGNLGMGLCSLGIGILFEFVNEFPGGFWIVVLLTFIYMTIHGGTLIPAVWVYVPEVSPGRAPQYSSITNWFMCSVTIVVFPVINLNYGYGPMFLAFGIISLALFLLNFFVMVESKPKDKDQVTVELRSSKD